MNQLIFTAAQKISHNRIKCLDYQHVHITNILKGAPDTLLKVAELNGLMGSARIASITESETILEIVELNKTPPPQIPLSIILALPRPQMMKRILQTVATMGVKDLILIQSNKVEKSFWQSPVLYEEEINRQIILGLEQGMATQAPKIHFHKRFIPFMEDEISSYTQGKNGYLADMNTHPISEKCDKQKESIFAIGPEGGFTENEVQRFVQAGFAPVQLGQRILKVETAITVVAAQFQCSGFRA